MKYLSVSKLFGAIVVATLLPSIVYAQTINDFLDDFLNLLNDSIPVIVGLAVIFFLWGLVTYILKTENKEARAEARSRMFWGIVIIFVMVSLWGFVNLFDETLGLDNDAPDLPELVGDGGGGCLIFCFSL